MIPFTNAEGLRDWRASASTDRPVALPRPSSLVWVVFALGIATGLLIGWAWLIAWTA